MVFVFAAAFLRPRPRAEPICDFHHIFFELITCLIDRHGTTVCILQFFNLISKSCHGMVHLSPAEHSELAGCIDIVIRGLMPLMSSSASRSTVDDEDQTDHYRSLATELAW